MTHNPDDPSSGSGAPLQPRARALPEGVDAGAIVGLDVGTARGHIAAHPRHVLLAAAAMLEDIARQIETDAPRLERLGKLRAAQRQRLEATAAKIRAGVWALVALDVDR
jgi:hypothetical protein